MPTPGATLPKSERLSGKTAVATLMSKGKWSGLGHFRYCFLPTDGENSRIIVSVPKKHFKRAVKRNLLKRRIRESFRTQKNLLKGSNDILFSYNSDEIADFPTIREEIAKILEQI